MHYKEINVISSKALTRYINGLKYGSLGETYLKTLLALYIQINHSLLRAFNGC